MHCIIYLLVSKCLEFKSNELTDGRLKNDTTQFNYFAFISGISHRHFDNECANFHTTFLDSVSSCISART
jgi:hypothetical protein